MFPNNYYMQQPQNIVGQPSIFYKPIKKITVKESGLFKLLKFDDKHILFAAPDADCLVLMNNQLDSKSMMAFYRPYNPSALDLVELGNKKFVVTGDRKGKIMVAAVDQIVKQENQKKDSLFQLNTSWLLLPNQQQQTYINDITHWPTNPNILVNCYNNGNLAVWGLASQKRLHTFKQAHLKYTYKIRFQTLNTIISCGHDCTVVRTDLEKQKYISLLSHGGPVWCAYPIDQNQVASVGLFGRVMVWDVRCNRVVQACSTFGHQSSYITTKPGNSEQLFYGDMPLLTRWDRRQSSPFLISGFQMNQSVQAILFSQDNLYVCGRGNDLCRLESTNTLSLQYSYAKEQISVKNFQQNREIQEDNDSDSDSDYEDIDSDENEENQQENVDIRMEMEGIKIKEQPSQNNYKKVQKQPNIESVAKLSTNLYKKYLKNQQKFTQLQESYSQSEQEQVQVQEYKIQSKVELDAQKPAKQIKQKKRQEDSKLLLQNQINKQQSFRNMKQNLVESERQKEESASKKQHEN